MKLFELLKKDFVIPQLESSTKEGVINEMIDLFKDDERVKDIEKVRESVLEREKIMSTGVGKSFAIPHGKTNAVTDVLCAFGRSAKPIDYESLDNKPVHLVFLLVGKENSVSMHIKLLSRISRMMSKDAFREKLGEAENEEAIYELFKKEEESYFDF